MITNSDLNLLLYSLYLRFLRRQESDFQRFGDSLGKSLLIEDDCLVIKEEWVVVNGSTAIFSWSGASIGGLPLTDLISEYSKFESL